MQPPTERTALREAIDSIGCHWLMGQQVLRLLDEADRLREEVARLREGPGRPPGVTGCPDLHPEERAALRQAADENRALDCEKVRRLFWERDQYEAWVLQVLDREKRAIDGSVANAEKWLAARAEADALRARVAELEGENATLRADTEESLRQVAIYAKALQDLPADAEEAAEQLQRRAERRADGMMRPMTDRLQATYERLNLPWEPTPTERAESAEQEADALRAFAARAVEMARTLGTTEHGMCRCCWHYDRPGHAPDCALATLLADWGRASRDPQAQAG